MEIKHMEIKHMDQTGIDHLVFEEGLKLKPYKDKAGVPTIGVGMTYYPETGVRVKLTDPPLANRAEAIRQFKLMYAIYEVAVWSVTRDDINQNQFNALVDTCYNIGIPAFKKSTLLKKVNADPNDFDGITKAFRMWKYSDGKIDPVLIARRERAIRLYFTIG